MNGIKIVALDGVPPGEAWFVEPVGYDMHLDGARLVLTRYDKVLGKFVGLGGGSTL